MRLQATSYIQTLSEFLLATQVTDQHGTVISLNEGTAKTVEMLLSVKSSGKKAMTIGNGGSISIASHTHNDLCNAVKVRALVFNDTPLLTAISNDRRYEEVFEQQVAFWADKGDLLLAISSSGHSENILRAVRVANEKQCLVITLSGFRPDNPLRRMGHVNFYVPAETYGYVEAAHSVLTHFLTDCAIECSNTL